MNDKKKIVHLSLCTLQIRKKESLKKVSLKFLIFLILWKVWDKKKVFFILLKD